MRVLFSALCIFVVLVWWWFNSYAMSKSKPTVDGVEGLSMAKTVDGVEGLSMAKTFDGVEGLSTAKAELIMYHKELIVANRFARFFEGGDEGGGGDEVANEKRGVLLIGPSGTGKTMLVNALARKAKVPLFSAGNNSGFVEGPQHITQFFKAAKSKTPCIIFIKMGHLDESSLKCLLMELDGVRRENAHRKVGEGKIYVIAATNSLELLGKGLASWFDKHVDVPLPVVKERMEILEFYLAKVRTEGVIDFVAIAKDTFGFSGSELANLVSMAELGARKIGRDHVDMDALACVTNKLLMSRKRMSENSAPSKLLDAYYSCGRAIVAWHTCEAPESYKVSTIRLHADGASGTYKNGSTLPRQMGKMDEDLTEKEKLKVLQILMGGRAAEELVFGESEVGPYCYKDLQNATSLARSIVVDRRHREKAAKKRGGKGLVDQGDVPVNAEMECIEKAYLKAKILVKKNIVHLQLLAAELLEKESLSLLEMKYISYLAREKQKASSSLP